VAGHLLNNESIGLIYFDMHADLNVPDSAPPGALDWMGFAHMLGSPGTVSELSHIGPRYPLLEPEQIILFAHRHDQATQWEPNEISRYSLARIPLEEVSENPELSAQQALKRIEKHCERILVYFDVDVIDFTDAPLSENTGRNIDLLHDTALRSVATFLNDSRLSALTITELNPEHSEPDGHAVKRFASALASAIKDCGN
jgi:arginase